MEYEVAFEISKSGIGNLTFALPGLAFIIIGILMFKFRGKLSQNRPKWFVNAFATFFLSFAVLWTLLAGIGIGAQQSSVRADYIAGKFDVVEGVVENFDPMPASGHKMESFTVGGVKFEYSDFVVTPGFNNATSKGGPIQEGMPVKISYIGNIILKLEIAKSANKSMQPTADLPPL
ncbi:hypothetical protein [Thalassolituus oleivorans]|uniref:hypothetical protein n=1 Tax=Thalassolituus oleivorans TaxID=187493 RepID=UPI002409B384|nr:hypothetical protein [Thalassolituus oleivorans]MDF1641641.1 hypothetical protein [Thalassolituus oleivorans]